MRLTYPIKRQAALTEVYAAVVALLAQREADEMLSHPPDVPLQSLPFDHESSDAEITAVMTGHVGSEITWRNSISGRLQHAVLVRFRSVVRRPGGRDYIEVLTDEGFHAIYLRRIMSIG